MDFQICFRLSRALRKKLIVSMNYSPVMQRRIFATKPVLKMPRRTKNEAIGGFGYALLVIPISTFCLGTWQVRRRQWKLDLIDSLQEKVMAPPIDLPEDLDELKNLEYRKIRARGTFDHTREVYLSPRSLVSAQGDNSGGGLISSPGKSGVNVITPFHLEDRDLTILVNRGWVPKNRELPTSRRSGQIEGVIELVGVIRHTEKRSPFMPKKNPDENHWLYRDTEAIARKCYAAPIWLDATTECNINEGPIGGQTRVSLRNEHFSYIITWYSLCVATTYLWYQKFFRSLPVI